MGDGSWLMVVKIRNPHSEIENPFPYHTTKYIKIDSSWAMVVSFSRGHFFTARNRATL